MRGWLTPGPDLARSLLAAVSAGLGTLILQGSGVDTLWILLPATLAIMWCGAEALQRLGRAVPVVRALGIDIMAAILIPSWMIAAGWIAGPVAETVRTLVSASDLLVWAVIVFVLGGVASLDRGMIATAAAQLALPVVGASLAAIAVGSLAAAVIFPGHPDAALLHVLPIMTGGVASGALPLSLALAQQTGMDQGEALARMLPSVIIANLTGILLAGGLGAAAGRRPTAAPKAPSGSPDAGPSHLILATGVVVALHAGGRLIEHGTGIPSVIVITTLILLGAMTGMVPESLGRGAGALGALAGRFLFVLLWLVGLAVVPWHHVRVGLSPEVLVTAVAVMLTLAGAGWFLSRLSRADPAEGALVALARGAMGGTGALLMLKAADRADLLPFAILSVRIGGAITLVLALNLHAMIPS